MNKSLSFQDILKSSVVSLQNSINISIFQILMVLTIAFAISLFILYIYRITFEGVVYSNSFATSMVLLALVTSMVIMTISSNIVLSLGMVGALSIVRFRAAIKDPKDIVFQFWAIAVGLSVGAGLYSIAIVASLFIGAILVILAKNKFNTNTYLLIIKYDSNYKENVLKITSKLKIILKSKTCVGNDIEETFEIKKVGENTSFVEYLSKEEGVKSSVLVKYSGDYAE